MRTPDVGQRFVELLDVMTRLRGAQGCPWDREQTRESLRPFLVEETYEVLEALDSREPSAIREELGDLLFQIVFHAEVARERGEFSMSDLLSALVAKMTRRHPHVFGEQRLGTAREALSQWEAIKRSEAPGPRRSALQGIPRGLPGLLRAVRLQGRASRVGFDWTGPVEALAKVREEVEELARALESGNRQEIRAELGDLLFAAINVARLSDVDPDAALEGALERFSTRFGRMEEAAAADGRELRSLTLDEMEQLWLDAKARESGS
jgi:tetrapyrrole methylase family protein/MazG family protein